jgi:hypothetical protein
MTTQQKNETKGIIPILEVPTEIYERLHKRAKEQGIDIGQVIADLIAESTLSESIAYEQVTIKVPKPIMAFLKFQAEKDGCPVEEEIEYDLLDNVRAEMEGLNGEDLIDALGVGRIFYEILHEEHYNPQKLKQDVQPQ